MHPGDGEMVVTSHKTGLVRNQAGGTLTSDSHLQSMSLQASAGQASQLVAGFCGHPSELSHWHRVGPQ